ncbi:hypothetical protein P5F12_13435 [Clostridium perfringens]|nr:hypothetical protein [Clostridium perfringens]
MCKVLIRQKEGIKEVDGRIYKGIGINKNGETYYCQVQKGTMKGFALGSCSKLKLIKKFIDEILDIVTLEELESDNFNPDLMRDIAILRNKYWLL